MSQGLSTQEKIALVRERFFHRDDVYTEQVWSEPNQSFIHLPVRSGYCPTPKECGRGTCEHRQNVPLTDRDVFDHLKGERTLGTYQLREDDTVRWLCLDVDVQSKGPLDGQEEALKEVQAHTLALAKNFAKHGIPFLVERSGGKGYHLWTFFSEPVPAARAQGMGSFLDLGVDPPDGISVEVFPKQGKLHSLGNLVKLPLGVHKKTGVRCFFVNNRFEEHPDQWAVLRDVGTMTRLELGVFTEEHDALIDAPKHTDVDLEESLVHSNTPLCFGNMMEQGFKEGSRDIGFFRLACHLRSKNFPRDIATIVLREVNAKGDPLPDDALDIKIESAYTHPYAPRPCAEKALDPYCVETCRFYPDKMRERGEREAQRARFKQRARAAADSS